MHQKSICRKTHSFEALYSKSGIQLLFSIIYRITSHHIFALQNRITKPNYYNVSVVENNRFYNFVFCAIYELELLLYLVWLYFQVILIKSWYTNENQQRPKESYSFFCVVNKNDIKYKIHVNHIYQFIVCLDNKLFSVIQNTFIFLLCAIKIYFPDPIIFQKSGAFHFRPNHHKVL